MDRDTQKAAEFNRILLEAIDEALSSLGQASKESIYHHMEEKFAIPRQEIPHRLGDFSDSLHRIFGIGASYLEILIMKNLHDKIQCQHVWNGSKWIAQDLNLKRYVDLMRLCYEGKDKFVDFEAIVDAGEQKEQRL